MLSAGQSRPPVSMLNSFCFTMEQSMTHKTEPCDLLIIDDDPEVLLAAELVLKKHFQSVTTTPEPQRIPELLGRRAFDVILLDMNFSAGATSGQEGLSWLKRALSIA